MRNIILKVTLVIALITLTNCAPVTDVQTNPNAAVKQNTNPDNPAGENPTSPGNNKPTQPGDSPNPDNPTNGNGIVTRFVCATSYDDGFITLRGDALTDSVNQTIRIYEFKNGQKTNSYYRGIIFPTAAMANPQTIDAFFVGSITAYSNNVSLYRAHVDLVDGSGTAELFAKISQKSWVTSQKPFSILTEKNWIIYQDENMQMVIFDYAQNKQVYRFEESKVTYPEFLNAEWILLTSINRKSNIVKSLLSLKTKRRAELPTVADRSVKQNGFTVFPENIVWVESYRGSFILKSINLKTFDIEDLATEKDDYTSEVNIIKINDKLLISKVSSPLFKNPLDKLNIISIDFKNNSINTAETLEFPSELTQRGSKTFPAFTNLLYVPETERLYLTAISTNPWYDLNSRSLKSNDWVRHGFFGCKNPTYVVESPSGRNE